MAGVRGFKDPNVQVNPDGLPVWYQSVQLIHIDGNCVHSDTNFARREDK